MVGVHYTAADRQLHLTAFLCRSVSSCFCPLDLHTSTNTLQRQMKLFRRILANPEQLLSNLIAPLTDIPYNLRQRHHNR